MQDQNQMETGKISNLVASYSIPAIIGMLVSAFYNIADRMWVGRIPDIGSMALNAIGVSLPFSTILTACCAFIATGAATTISTQLGKNENSSAEKTLGNTILLTVLLAFTYSLIGLAFLDTFLGWMGASGNIYPYAAQYQSIIFTGSIFQFFSYVVAHTIRAAGNLKRFSRTIILGAVLNILLDPIFIFGLGLGIKGAAYATNLAAGISAVYGFSYYFGGKSPVNLKIMNLKPDKSLIFSVVTIGGVSFIFQLLLGFISGFSNSALSKYGSLEVGLGGINGAEIGGVVIANGGDYALGAMAVVMSITMLFLMPVMGIVQGVQPIISYNFGAKKISRVKEAYQFAVIYAVGFCAVGILIIEILAPNIAAFFSKDPISISVTTTGMRIFLIGLPFVAFQLISICLMQSIKHIKSALFLTLFRQVFLYFPLLFLLPQALGFWGVWIAGPSSDIFAAAVTLYFARREIRYLNNLHENSQYDLHESLEMRKDEPL